MSQERLTVGSETQADGTHTSISGIPRVTREAHVGLDAVLRPMGIDLVPVHTRATSPPAPASRDADLADDPVLTRPVHAVEDVDGLLLLGLSMTTDFGRILRRRRERPLPMVSLVYDVLPLRRPELFPPRAREHYRVYLQQLLRVSDHVVVTSAAVRTDLLELGWRISGDIHVLPLGSSFPLQPPTLAPDPPLGLLYVSTVAPRKGHLLLLEVFDSVRSRGVPVELTIVGKQGWMAEDIAEVIVSHPEHGRSLTWHRSASDADIVSIARRCHIAVVPAEDEGYGLFLDEGLTLGLTCVARDIPVFRERTYPNLHFAAGSAEAMTDAILRARRTPPRALAPGDIRTMDAFTTELAALVLAALS